MLSSSCGGIILYNFKLIVLTSKEDKFAHYKPFPGYGLDSHGLIPNWGKDFPLHQHIQIQHYIQWVPCRGEGCKAPEA